MGYTEELQDIVKKSINSVLCIDDEFVEPYSNEPDELEKKLEYEDNKAFAKKIYEAIAKECGCSVEILRYVPGLGLEELDRKLVKKDLLLLDWELTKTQNIKKTLDILDRAVLKKLPYVCIYTNVQALDEICRQIENHYCGYSEEYVKECEEKMESKGIYVIDFADEIAASVEKEWDPRRILKKYEELEIKISDEEKEYYTKKETWKLRYLAKERTIFSECSEQYIAVWVGNTQKVLKVGGTLISCFSKVPKVPEKRELVVKPEDLIMTLANSITEDPNNIFDCIWLHYANEFNNVLLDRMNFLKDIPYDAFSFYTSKLLETGEIELHSFFKEMYKSELEDRLDAQKIEIPVAVMRKLYELNKVPETEKLFKGLFKLNERLNQNKGFSTKEHQIYFGDVFRCTERDESMCEYWLCVTAKCDCHKPEKIWNEYFFVGGRELKNSRNVLEQAEKKHLSFVRIEDKVIAIEWCNRLQTIVFDENNVIRGTKIRGYVRKQEKEFEYLINVKDSYAQRMANEAFAFGNRVGVSLANMAK